MSRMTNTFTARVHTASFNLKQLFQAQQSSRQIIQILHKENSLINDFEMSPIVRKPDFCLGENKGADQLRGYREADQRLCFRYLDSTISLLLKSEISSF